MSDLATGRWVILSQSLCVPNYQFAASRMVGNHLLITGLLPFSGAEANKAAVNYQALIPSPAMPVCEKYHKEGTFPM
ncbi:MAG: hypothetical protein RIC30_00945 [Marinoscillum sp.]|uniref:hypothetical protein n=1 Tax=Marinoscillum sp. TaxID=2024838 RepID=UPI0032F23896